MSPPAIQIRPRLPRDTLQISTLYYNTIHAINAEHYNDKQIAAWAPDVHNTGFWLDRWQNCLVLVAVKGDTVVGFAELRPTGEVDCLYVHQDYQRQGVASQLMARVAEDARAQKIERLYADVSITARPFFLAMGFLVVREQIVSYRGEDFQQFFMERQL